MEMEPNVLLKVSNCREPCLTELAGKQLAIRDLTWVQQVRSGRETWSMNQLLGRISELLLALSTTSFV